MSGKDDVAVSPELVYRVGIFLIGISIIGATVAALVLRVSKSKIDKQLDAEYGKRVY